MITLRRILTGAALTAMACGLASADTIISYTNSIPPQTTELLNQQLLLTAWNPGGGTTQDSIASDASTPSIAGLTDNAFGVTMASLDAPNTIYTLVSYDIYVTGTLSGSFSVSNNANASTSTTGTVHVNSYSGVALGGPNSPPLSNTDDSANDLFNNGSNPGAGPNAQSPTASYSTMKGTQITPGTTASTSFSNKSSSADLGYFYANGTSTPIYTPINSTEDPGLSNVTSTDPLDFFVSTATNIDTSLSGGNVATTQNTVAGETITVIYDYTTTVVSSTPEPTTMLLMGGALVGLGLIRKRVKSARS